MTELWKIAPDILSTNFSDLSSVLQTLSTQVSAANACNFLVAGLVRVSGLCRTCKHNEESLTMQLLNTSDLVVMKTDAENHSLCSNFSDFFVFPRSVPLETSLNFHALLSHLLLHAKILNIIYVTIFCKNRTF